MAAAAEEIARRMIGRSVFVRWPNLTEALVTAVSCSTREFYPIQVKDKDSKAAATAATEEEEEKDFVADAADAVVAEVQGIMLDSTARRQWEAEAEDEERAWLHGKGSIDQGGLATGRVDIRVQVKELVGMERDARGGGRFKVFSSEAKWVPLQIAFPATPAPDPRFQETGARDIAMRYPVGTKAVFLGIADAAKGEGKGKGDGEGEEKKKGSGSGSVPLFGSVGVVTAHNSGGPGSNTVTIELSPPAAREAAFGHIVARSVKDKYAGTREIAHRLGLQAGTVGKLLGSALFEPGRIDLGLNLRVGNDMRVQGYARFVSLDPIDNGDGSEGGKNAAAAAAAAAAWTPAGNKGRHMEAKGGYDKRGREGGRNNGRDRAEKKNGYWEFSTRAFALLEAYKKRFPRLIAFVDNNASSYKYDCRKAFGSGAGAEARMQEVVSWLKQLPSHRMALSPVSSCALGPDAVVAMQSAQAKQREVLSRAAGSSGSAEGADPNAAATTTTTVKLTGVSPLLLFQPDVGGHARRHARAVAAMKKRMREEAERQRQRKEAERAAAAGGWKRAGQQKRGGSGGRSRPPSEKEREEHRGRVNLAATGFDLGDRVCNLACTEAPVGLFPVLFFSTLLFSSLLFSSLLCFCLLFFSIYFVVYLISHTPHHSPPTSTSTSTARSPRQHRRRASLRRDRRGRLRLRVHWRHHAGRHLRQRKGKAPPGNRSPQPLAASGAQADGADLSLGAAGGARPAAVANEGHGHQGGTEGAPCA